MAAPQLIPLVTTEALDAGLSLASAQAIARFCASGVAPTAYDERCELTRALKKLRARLKGAWHGPVSRHARLILSLQRNRALTDDRPPGMSGVAPDWRAHSHVYHPAAIGPEDWPLGAQAQIWARSLLTS